MVHLDRRTRIKTTKSIGHSLDEFLKGSAAPAEEHGLTAIRPGGEGDVTSTRVLWKQSRGEPEVPAPLYYKGRVYTVT